MANSRFQNQIHEGMVVRSSDGEKLGKVRQLFATSFDIEKGFFFPKEYVVSYDDVAGVREGEIFLARARSELSAQEPEARDQGAVTRGSIGAISAEAAPISRVETEEARIPLVEEELSVEKHVRQTGEVLIHKEVVTEEKTITVPVMREVIRTETVPATGATTPTAAAVFQEETIEIPIHKEEVEVTKRPVVREEVRVTKLAEEVPEAVAATVRRERAEISSEGEVRQSIVPQETRSEDEETAPLPKRTGTTG